MSNEIKPTNLALRVKPSTHQRIKILSAQRNETLDETVNAAADALVALSKQSTEDAHQEAQPAAA